eukprot:4248298-Lingulodinium_polyedra.AAC.1
MQSIDDKLERLVSSTLAGLPGVAALHATGRHVLGGHRPARRWRPAGLRGAAAEASRQARAAVQGQSAAAPSVAPLATPSA